jgi:N-acetylmuramoyl-L-alanine amidase
MFKIVLDAGHGYETAGKRTVDGSMREWEFNNTVALKVAEKLKGYENVTWLLTHDKTGKEDIPLKNRTDNANKWGADVFVSIHANANGSGEWDSASGIETYIYTNASNESLVLASTIQNHLIRETNRKNRGVKKANLYVTKNTNMPACLVECGFMTNKEEAALLKTDKYREQCANAIVKGLVEVYKLKAKPETAPAPKKEEVQKPKTDGKTFYRVVTGSFSDRKNAEEMIEKLKKTGFDSFIDIYEK